MLCTKVYAHIHTCSIIIITVANISHLNHRELALLTTLPATDTSVVSVCMWIQIMMVWCGEVALIATTLTIEMMIEDTLENILDIIKQQDKMFERQLEENLWFCYTDRNKQKDEALVQKDILNLG